MPFLHIKPFSSFIPMHPSLSVARMALTVSQPFFANLTFHLAMREDPSVPTACTNGTDLRYNPQFIDRLATTSQKHVTGVFAHEALHCALLHCMGSRRQGRDPVKWNIACDYVVNGILLQTRNVDRSGADKGPAFTLPGRAISLKELREAHAQAVARLSEPGSVPGSLTPATSGSLTPATSGAQDEINHLHDPSLAGQCVESIYNQLPDPPRIAILAVQGMGGVEDAGNQPGDDDGDGADSPTASEIEAKWRVALAQAATAARAQGKLPGHLAQLVESILQPKLPWQALLRNFVRDLQMADWSWLRPQKGMLAVHGILLPSLKSETCGPLVVACDTSGSMDDALLAEFIAEIQAIGDEVRPSCLTVMDCDAQVHTVKHYQPGDVIEREFHGRGGTDFRPVFDRVAAEGIDPCCLIYLTDMYGTFPPADPGYPVLWISYSPVNAAPFGTVVMTKP